jgi:hypothetical protein
MLYGWKLQKLKMVLNRIQKGRSPVRRMRMQKSYDNTSSAQQKQSHGIPHAGPLSSSKQVKIKVATVY